MLTAAAVDALIEAIGEVTLESGEAIEAARSAYDALTDAQKGLVNNIDLLIAAEETYADHVAAANVNALIEAIGEVTLESGEAIEAARSAYDALTDAQKDIVDGYLDSKPSARLPAPTKAKRRSTKPAAPTMR